MRKKKCPKCGKLCHPQGIPAHLRSHKKKSSEPVNKQGATIEQTLGILTDDDPTLSGVIRQITDKYNEMDSPASKADYLNRLYNSLEYIDQRMETDEE
jgi:hypothetical protein